MSRPRSKGTCSCGHEFRPQPAPGRVGRLAPRVFVDVLARHPRMAGSFPLADSVDQSVRWSA